MRGAGPNASLTIYGQRVNVGGITGKTGSLVHLLPGASRNKPPEPLILGSGPEGALAVDNGIHQEGGRTPGNGRGSLLRSSGAFGGAMYRRQGQGAREQADRQTDQGAPGTGH